MSKSIDSFPSIAASFRQFPRYFDNGEVRVGHGQEGDIRDYYNAQIRRLKQGTPALWKLNLARLRLRLLKI